ncbi:MAG: C45 family peptidase [Saprospiraceae bacterium]
MKKIIFLFIVQWACSSAFSQSVPITRQLKLISLSGTGYERGYQHGQQLKKEIEALIGIWKKDLEHSMQMPADSFLAHFMASTNFMLAIKKYTPEILEEVKGIAVGSGQTFNDIYAFQLVDEYWVYQDQLRNNEDHHHCSSIGVPAMNGHPAYVSQNLDVESWMDGYQIILQIMPNGNTPEQYILSCAGLVALNGFNEHGIGVCVNTLMQLNASADGLPVAFMLRGILGQKKGSDALRFLQTTKHASGQNYILGTVDSVYNFEASSAKVMRMYPDASGMVFHTNNPVVNEDIKPWYKNYFNSFLAGKTQKGNSEIRFTTLQRRAANATSKDDSFIKTTLRSKDDPNNPVCRAHVPNKGGFTFASVIYTLSGTRTMQVTAGPPDESEYQVFSFAK